jgi:hypothetical protein
MSSRNSKIEGRSCKARNKISWYRQVNETEFSETENGNKGLVSIMIMILAQDLSCAVPYRNPDGLFMCLNKVGIRKNTNNSSKIQRFISRSSRRKSRKSYRSKETRGLSDNLSVADTEKTKR